MPKKTIDINMFYQKHGLVVSYLVKTFLSMEAGTRMDTIEEISSALNVGRGTVQTALAHLKAQGAVKTESKGHLGTCVTEINYDKLLILTGIENIMGVMPVLRSKKLEGLAEGIQACFKHLEGIDTEISFVHGAQNRIASLLAGRYDFAILSHQSAKKYMASHESSINIVKVIDGASYIDRHVLVAHTNFIDNGQSAIRVGVDFSSDDQALMTLRYFQNKNIIIISCQSNNLAEALKNNFIDCAIDSSGNNYSSFDYIKVSEIAEQNDTCENTETAVVVRADDPIMQRLLKRNLDPDLIKAVQNNVLQKNITPS